MKRLLYAVCPRCGKPAAVTGFIRYWEEDESVAQIRCACGRSQMPCAEHRVLQIDLVNPYMEENHFDLLIPPGWTREMWNKASAGLPRR